MQGETRNLRNCLVFDRRQLRDKPWLTGLDRAIRENPDCERGVMTRQGWAYSANGPNSHGENPELLVQVAEGLCDGPQGLHWYGHVFLMPDCGGSECWIAILVRTWLRLDSHSAESVLKDYRHVIAEKNAYDPGYKQEEDDIASRHDSFEDAVEALTAKIGKFRRDLRDPRVVRCEEPWDGVVIPIEGPPPDSELDLRIWQVYGFMENLCSELGKRGT